MRTTVDLADETYREAKVLAAQRGITLKRLLGEAVEQELRRVKSAGARQRLTFPLLDSKEPASVDLSNAEIEELLT